MSGKPIEVAIAILYRHDQFLMQLRDPIPSIVHPGCWSLFGGHLEAGETPPVALKRELLEEISYSPPEVWPFRSYSVVNVIRHVFYAPLTVELNQLVLLEGWDMGLLTVEQIRSGRGYSEKTGELMPVATPHQEIVLDFWNSLDRPLPKG